MSLNATLGIVSSIVLFIPAILILVFRLITNRSFLALSVYYLVAGIYNLISQNVLNTPVWLARPLGIAVNLLDAPLMMLFLTFFSTSQAMTRRIIWGIWSFFAFEAVILLIEGFSVNAVRVILGPDILIIIALSFFFFQRYVRLAITNSKSLGKAIMSSSVLLSYTIFTVVYVFYYLMKNQQYQKDAAEVYYLISILSALLMSAGIITENKRIKKLDELKNTRKELATIYGKTAGLNKDSRFLKTGH
jgi:hypothetical protein